MQLMCNNFRRTMYKYIQCNKSDLMMIRFQWKYMGRKDNHCMCEKYNKGVKSDSVQTQEIK